MIETFTWAELGYRRLPPELRCSDGMRIVRNLTSTSGYEVKEDAWIRHPARCRSTGARILQCVAEVDARSATDQDTWNFIDEYFRWMNDLRQNGTFNSPSLVATPDDLIDLLQESERTVSDEPWRLMKSLGDALFYSIDIHQFRTLLTGFVLPAFFKRYPQGHVLFIREQQESYGLLAAMRSMYTAAQLPACNWKQSGIDKFGTLRQWHVADPTSLARTIVGACQYLWYPHVSGVVLGPFGLMTLFLCDPPDAHVPERFPRDWLAFQQHRSAFGNEKSDVFDVIRNPKGPEYWQAAHQRPIHDAIPEVAARIEFMHWLLERLDTWLFDICDVANFLKSQQADADIDSIAAFEHFLSINRLIQRIASLATSSDIGNAKTIVFEVADLLGTIRRRFNPNKNDVATFKELFDPDIAPKIIVSALLTIPGVGSDLAKIAITVYEKLRETIINSVWIRSKVDPDGILVADKDLKSESKEGFGEFVANVMRALRNGHHGYFTEPKFHNIPSRYLFMVDGNTPNEMIQLPMLWFLAYLADPSILDWKPLPFGHFD